MSVDELLLEIEERGWLLNNLFQRDDGSWQCNLRTVTHHTAYGKGPSPDLALAEAIDAIETALETVPDVEALPYGRSELIDSLPDHRKFNEIMASALANLRQPTAPMFRRKL